MSAQTNDMKVTIRTERLFLPGSPGEMPRDPVWIDLRVDPPLVRADRDIVQTYLQKVLAPMAKKIRLQNPEMADLANEAAISSDVSIGDVHKVLAPRIQDWSLRGTAKAAPPANRGSAQMRMLDKGHVFRIAHYMLKRGMFPDQQGYGKAVA